MANNKALYDASIAGAGGAAQRGWLISTNAGDYISFAVNVDILAVAIDLQIAPIAAGPSISQINLLQSITEAVLSARYPIANAPATYVDIGRAIATLFNALSPLLKNNPTIITNILTGTGITVSIVNSVATITATAPIWQTMWDVDFTAQPDQALNADGVYIIGGRNWTVENSVNTYPGSIGMRIVNGNGLVLPCQANVPATYWPQYRLYPTIGSILDSGLTKEASVLIAIEHGASIAWGHELFFGAEYPSTVSRTNVGCGLNIAPGSSVFTSWGTWRNNTALYDPTVAASAKIYANNDIGQMVFRSGLSNFASFDLMSGISGNGDWNDSFNLPLLDTLNWTNFATLGSPVTKTICDVRLWHLFLSNHAGSLGANYEQVVRKAKCMVYR